MTVRLGPWAAADTPALVEVFAAACQHGYPDVLPADVLGEVQAPQIRLRRDLTAPG